MADETVRTKHTPGPWRLIATRKRAAVELVTIQQDDGTPYGARVAAITADYVTGDLREVVSAEGMANARVIAAAPDLLEALRGLLSAGDANGHHPYCGGYLGKCDLPACAAARAAIAKAEGQP